MKKKRHTVDQIIKILRQVDEGFEIEAACREHNIGNATFHRWRRKYGKMEMKDAKRLKELEKENTELKKIVADQMLNIRVLEAVNAKKW
jgi:putative transposase|tara:strand:+ start:62 stop:328 length:267 start_codon:yes stop_codon:yes gene_type:complete